MKNIDKINLLKKLIKEDVTLSNITGLGDVTLPTDNSLGSGDIISTTDAFYDKLKDDTEYSHLNIMSYNEFINEF